MPALTHTRAHTHKSTPTHSSTPRPSTRTRPAAHAAPPPPAPPTSAPPVYLVGAVAVRIASGGFASPAYQLPYNGCRRYTRMPTASPTN